MKFDCNTRVTSHWLRRMEFSPAEVEYLGRLFMGRTLSQYKFNWDCMKEYSGNPYKQALIQLFIYAEHGYTIEGRDGVVIREVPAVASKEALEKIQPHPYYKEITQELPGCRAITKFLNNKQEFIKLEKLREDGEIISEVTVYDDGEVTTATCEYTGLNTKITLVRGDGAKVVYWNTIEPLGDELDSRNSPSDHYSVRVTEFEKKHGEVERITYEYNEHGVLVYRKFEGRDYQTECKLDSNGFLVDEDWPTDFLGDVYAEV